MMYDGNGGWVWWWMIPMMLLTVALVVGIVWAIVHALQPPNPVPGTSAAPPLTPEQVLAHRLAAGEIDVAEYRERMEALRHLTG